MNKTNLYRYYDAEGDLLYVGITNSALRRLDGHMNGKSWFDDIARVEIQQFDSRAEAHVAERLAIQVESPKHNRIRYTPKPPKAAPKPRQTKGELNSTTRRRLERAGFVALPNGYVPASFAERVKQQVEAYRDDVERVIAEPPMPRGRPRKGAEHQTS